MVSCLFNKVKRTTKMVGDFGLFLLGIAFILVLGLSIMLNDMLSQMFF